MNDIIDNSTFLTPEQKELALAKARLTNALTEVKQEMQDIDAYLQQLQGEPFCDFIHRLMLHKGELNAYLSIAKNYMTAYSYTRQRLISFADDEDIYFIPDLLLPTQTYLERIMALLKKEKDTILKYKDQLSSQTIEDVYACFYFFASYQMELEAIQHQYDKLFDTIYHSTDEGYSQRAQAEFASIFAEYAARFKTIFNIKEPSKTKLERITFNLPFPPPIDKQSIDKLKVSILQVLQQMAPDITQEEFIDQTHLAKYIHQKRLLHYESNRILCGYYQLHQLEEIKQNILAEKADIKRGPKRCTCFDDIDKEMLRQVYQLVYQQEKSIIQKHDEFATLFLIGMTCDNPMYLDRKMAECHRILSQLFTNIKYSLRTIQRHWRQYICNTAKHIQTWKDCVKRIIQQLRVYKLFFQLN